MLDKTYNPYRIEDHGINLDDHPEYRTYQTFSKMGIAPPSHEEMTDIIIQASGQGQNGILGKNHREASSQPYE